MTIDRHFLILLLGLAVLGGPTAGAADDVLPVVTIGLVTDGPEARTMMDNRLFADEILALTIGEFDVRFPEDKQLNGGWTAAGARTALERLFADPEVDLVVALGVIASVEACRMEHFLKPTFAPWVLDPQLHDLPIQSDGTSGVHNLSYVVPTARFDRHLDNFRELSPFTRLAMVVDQAFIEAFPGIFHRGTGLAEARGITITPVLGGTDPQTVLDTLPADTEAVIFAPLMRMTWSDFEVVCHGLIERRLPSYSILGRSEVRRGILATSTPKADWKRLARRLALNIQKTLLGEDPAGFSTRFEELEQLTLNASTMAALELSPRWSVLSQAEFVGEDDLAPGRRLSIAGTVREAVEANLDLAAARRKTAAGEAEVREARAGLLPQLDLSANGTRIDEDRAAAGLGAQPERTVSTGATLSQVIWSDAAWSGLEIQKQLQMSRLHELESVRLDTVLDASTAFINVLSAKTTERIQRENLRRSRENLKIARSRREVGTAGPAEVYRWESAIATGRSDVLTAQYQRQQAEASLNQLLHRPVDEVFSTEELHFDDPQFLSSDPKLHFYISNPRATRVFGDFLVSEGLAESLELRHFDNVIAARKRSLGLARRAYWSPTLALQGSLTEMLVKGGAGSEGGGLPGIEPADDTNWSVALNLSLPLFQGGARAADVHRAKQELARLQLQRDAATERIELGIRTAFFATSASSPGIELSRAAARAAGKNLELVTDAYARGAVSIVDLIDAQNSALVAGQAASNAEYNFLIDLMQLERVLSRFDFFTSAEDRDQWFSRLETYYQTQLPAMTGSENQSSSRREGGT